MLFIRESAIGIAKARASPASASYTSSGRSKSFMKKAPRGAFFLTVSYEPYQARMAITLTV
jgi:hypothetical protein